MDKIRIIIADDHPVYRGGLCHMLEHCVQDIEVVAVAENGEEAVALVERYQPDVGVIDYSMPRLNGIETTKRLRATCPGTAILVMSGYDQESYFSSSLQAGAAGYLLKTASLQEIVDAIHSVHVGKCVFDVKSVSNVLRRLAGNSDRQETQEKLHWRELQILRLVAKAMANKRIATELGIGERTVQTHLVNMFKKMQVNSRVEAVIFALKQGWLTRGDLP